MSGGWNAHPSEERRIAQRLWQAKMPRKDIARILGLPEGTIHHWRWEDQWEPRKSYADRPVKVRTGKKKNGLRDCPRPSIWRCEHCSGRCDSPEGHVTCRPAA